MPRLTPDIHGSYVKGAWSTLASMHDTRYDGYASDVLQDGRGLGRGWRIWRREGHGGSVMRPLEIIPGTAAPVPLALLEPNSAIAPKRAKSQGFYDAAISKILPDGNVLIAPDAAGAIKRFVNLQPGGGNAWLKGPTFFRRRLSGPIRGQLGQAARDDSILTVDPSSTTSERYASSSNLAGSEIPSSR